jgi:hypothetical protein
MASNVTFALAAQIEALALYKLAGEAIDRAWNRSNACTAQRLPPIYLATDEKVFIGKAAVDAVLPAIVTALRQAEAALGGKLRRPCGDGCNNPKCCEVRCHHPIPQPAEAAPGVVEALEYKRMASSGRCDWTNLREAVSEAVNGGRENSTPFDPSYAPGHQIVPQINYNSLDRIVTAFVDEALARQHGAREWQSMDSAPIDKMVLVHCARFDVCEAIQYRGTGWHTFGANGPFKCEPTVWQPKPAAPATDVGEK